MRSLKVDTQGSRVPTIIDRSSIFFIFGRLKDLPYIYNLKQKDMTLKERISADYMTAFKAKDSVVKNLLSVIKGEIQTIEKNTGIENMSDEDVTKILNKTVKSLKETLQASDSVDTKLELVIIESYLPKQLSKEEIFTKVTDLKSAGITNIGQIMKEFAALPVDRKIVSEAIKEIIG